eukprot:CAMPEP_0176236358 /NCGR_PEP_ID=MMETSP0121_2-20121125/27302_1 /TAXON_ID=160619 /ORGANISM="Kryptoperidinium foliaceum, Strain CCMP 1326" /LENGTH=183 /DNA_ID=CAMNT_0017575787 /DNA_START=130 /DNA_END=678 /DNA_ORIENTATION=-
MSAPQASTPRAGAQPPPSQLPALPGRGYVRRDGHALVREVHLVVVPPRDLNPYQHLEDEQHRHGAEHLEGVDSERLPAPRRRRAAGEQKQAQGQHHGRGAAEGEEAHLLGVLRHRVPGRGPYQEQVRQGEEVVRRQGGDDEPGPGDGGAARRRVRLGGRSGRRHLTTGCLRALPRRALGPCAK